MRIISHGAIIVMTLLLWHPTAVNAQTLKGLKRIAIIGDVLLIDNLNCGIAKEDLETAVGFIVQQSHLQIATDKIQGFLQPRINILVPSWRTDACFVNVDLSFITHVVGTAPYGPYDRQATIVMTTNQVFSGDRLFVKKAATDFIEQATKEFIVRWSKENP